MRSLLFAVLFSCAAVAWAGPEEDAQKQMAKGAKAFTQNKFSDAALSFNRALEILPDAAGPHRELGKCYQKLNEPERAIHHYTQYLTKRPDAEERKTIEAILVEVRDTLPTKGRALVSIEAFPGATVYVIAPSGEEQGIGVSPLQRHPVDPRFTTLRLLTRSKETKEKTLQLTPSNELLVAESDFGTPSKQPEPVVTQPKLRPGALDPSKKPAVDAVPMPPKQRPPALAFAALGVSGVGVVVGGVSGALFFQTTSEMQAGLDGLEGAPIEEKIATTQELRDLDQRAVTLLRVAQLSGGVAVASAVVGVVLLRKAKGAKVEASLGLDRVAVAVSF